MKQRYSVPAISAFLLLFLLFLAGPTPGFCQSDQADQYLVVAFAPGTKAQKSDAIREKLGIGIPKWKHKGTEIWKCPDNWNIDDLLSGIQGQEGIAYVERNLGFEANVFPDDPGFPQQWGLNNSGQNNGIKGADVGILRAWEFHQGSSSVISGIIDTGIDYGHEDLVDNIWQNLAEDADGDGHTLEMVNGTWQLDPGDLDGIDNDQNGYVDDLIGWDFVNNDNNPFDDNGHGTHVAGILGAKGNNGKGIAGVSWNASIMALKAFDGAGNGDLASILPAMQYAQQMGARLTNNSWGGELYSQALFDLIQEGEALGHLVVAASGNKGRELAQNPVYPAAYPLDNVISVAASNRHDHLASFSNFGRNHADIMAPGKEIYSTLPGNTYGPKSGTSMATPFVTGSLSLIESVYPGLSVLELKAILLAGADKSQNGLARTASNGRLNIYKMMLMAGSNCDQITSLTQGFSITDIEKAPNCIWAGTEGNGLIKINIPDCSFEIFNEQNSGLPSNEIQSIAIDTDGNIWIGADQDLVMYDGQSWTTYNSGNSGMVSAMITSLAATETGEVWVGTDKKGLVKFDGISWTNFQVAKNGLPSKKVRDVSVGESGIILVATDKGVAKYTGSSWEVFHTKQFGVPNNKAAKVSVDANGHWWVIASNRIGNYDGVTWKEYDHGDLNISVSQIYTAGKSSAGHFWAGTGNGLVRKGMETQLYSVSNSSIPNNHIRTILIDEIDNVWVGTNNGLAYVKTRPSGSFTLNGHPCVNTVLQFLNTSQGSNQAAWWIDGTFISDKDSLDYTFTTPGFHVIELVATRGILADTIRKMIEVIPNPSIDLGQDTTACANVVVLTGGPAGLDYQWFDQQGMLIGTEAEIRLYADGMYHAEATNVCGVTSRDTIQVTLSGDCVWPGDVNADGKADMLDFLCLGWADGWVGSQRTDPSPAWQPQQAADWNEAFPPSHILAAGIDFKHADCDGDGFVDLEADRQVIQANIRPTELPEVNSDSAYLETGLVFAGSTVISSEATQLSYYIYLEDPAGNMITNVSGFSAVINFNMGLSSLPEVNATNTWLANPLAMGQYHPEAGQMDIAVVSPAPDSSGGSGEVARLDIVITVDDIAEDPLAINYQSFSADLENILFLDQNGEPLPVVTSVQNTVSISGKELESLFLGGDIAHGLKKFRAFPNPAKDETQVSFSVDEEMPVEMKLMDISGKEIRKSVLFAQEGMNTIPVDLKGISGGIYLVQLSTYGERQIKKLVVK